MRKDYYDRVNNSYLCPVSCEPNSGDAYINMLHAEFDECKNALMDAMVYLQQNGKKDDLRFLAASFMHNAFSMFDGMFEDYADGATAEARPLESHLGDLGDKAIMLLKLLNLMDERPVIIDHNEIPDYVKENISV